MKKYHYLIKSLICFAIGIIASLFIGCTSIEMQGKCRHEALYAASVFAENYPTRVVLGPPGHGQAQCFIDGKWEWLRRDGSIVYVSKQDDFTPERWLTLDEYIETLKASYPWK